jgi:small subunit ribosomal protein S17
MGKRKTFVGTVISDKMQKTVIVSIMRLSKHPKYSKIVKRYSKFKAHDEKNLAKVGDSVRIEETRPLSKDKRFRVVQIIKKAQTPHAELKEEVQ